MPSYDRQNDGALSSPRNRFAGACAVSPGLRALQRQHAAGDSSVYPLFYSQGATFWFEIDRALQARNGQGLDELVPGLIHGSFAANDGLPESFTEELRERLGPDARSILDRYY